MAPDSDLRLDRSLPTFHLVSCGHCLDNASEVALVCVPQHADAIPSNPSDLGFVVSRHRQTDSFPFTEYVYNSCQMLLRKLRHSLENPLPIGRVLLLYHLAM